MDISELKIYCRNNMKKMKEIEDFINFYFTGKEKFDVFDPAKERIEEINKNLLIIKENIQALNNKYRRKFNNGLKF